ncbi:MAG: CehA/McbA family metallohydrolase [Candidatus Diapherotrites archaeon]|nr:CehA/McbA family metallohydrolase [Candidatus Diapherotrites archaeon]
MKFDLHVHSVHSADSLMTVQDIIGRIKELGFAGFALTDHNSVAGNKEAAKLAKEAGLVFIPGIEVSTQDGHLLGLGATKIIKAYMPAEKTVKEIHRQKGLAIAAHPYDYTRHGMGDKWREIGVDGIEAINGKSFVGNSKAKKVAKELGVTVTGGSDAHTKAEMGSAWTECGKDVFGDIRKGKTSAHGRASVAALTSRVYRRLKGTPMFPKF